MVAKKKGRRLRTSREQRHAQQLGGRLVKRRLELELSQTEVARRCGWKATRLWKYETGHDVPSIPSIRKLAKVLDISVQELIALANGNDEDDEPAGVLVGAVA